MGRLASSSRLSFACPAILRLAHESGFPVFVWTVNDPADMLYFKRIGVDGIITDRLDVLLHLLDARVDRSRISD